MRTLYNLKNKKDVQALRRKKLVGSAHYIISDKELDEAHEYLTTLYEGVVTYSFTSKILLLNELY